MEDTGQILKFENHLTGSVAHSLSLTLLAGKTAEHTPINNAAHDAYLQGLYYVAQRSRIGWAMRCRVLERLWRRIHSMRALMRSLPLPTI